MRPVHPGEILQDELGTLDISARALAKALGIPTNRVTAILNGTRSITADTAFRLSRYFGTGPEIWMNLGITYDLAMADKEDGKVIRKRIRRR